MTAEPSQSERVADAMRAFAEDLDREHLPRTVVTRISAAFGVACALGIRSDDGARIDLVAWELPDLPPDARADLDRLASSFSSDPLPVDSPHPLAEVVRTGEVICLADLTDEQLRQRYQRPEDHRLATSRGYRHALHVPLRARGASIGAILVGRFGADSPRFTPEEVALVRQLADHAALAITNARLVDRLQRELVERIRLADRLRLLSDTARELAEAVGDVGRILQIAVRQLGRGLNSRCGIRLTSRDGRALGSLAAVYPEDDPLSARIAEVTQTSQPAGAGILGRALATGQPVLVRSPEEIAALGIPPLAALSRDLGLATILAVPMRSIGREIGVVALFRAIGQPGYSDRDGEVAVELAGHASLAVHNAWLLAAAQRELAERERAEAALRRTEEQFRQAQKMEAIGRLAGGVAHDFNNLLSVVLCHVGLAADQLRADDPVQDDLAQIQAAGERAADLTRQLLAFGRRQVMSPRVVLLDEVVRDTEKLLRRVVGEDVAVRLHTRAGLGRAKVDPSLLSQVITNLVVNARDAMPAGGTLTLSTRSIELEEGQVRDHPNLQPGPHLEIEVADTGHGIAPEDLPHIFEPFFTTKEVGQGTGLGLSTVLGIVEQSGGALEVESEVGRGTTFRIWLPETAEAATAVAPPPRAEPPEGAAILLVEDDDQVRNIAAAILRRAGHRVIDVGDPLEALRLALDPGTRFDLLLTDVVMPGMSGPELVRALVGARPDLRVLFVSGYAARALESDLPMVEKPLRPSSLLARVAEVLSKR